MNRLKILNKVQNFHTCLKNFTISRAAHLKLAKIFYIWKWKKIILPQCMWDKKKRHREKYVATVAKKFTARLRKLECKGRPSFKKGVGGGVDEALHFSTCLLKHLYVVFRWRVGKKMSHMNYLSAMKTRSLDFREKMDLSQRFLSPRLLWLGTEIVWLAGFCHMQGFWEFREKILAIGWKIFIHSSLNKVAVFQKNAHKLINYWMIEVMYSKILVYTLNSNGIGLTLLG